MEPIICTCGETISDKYEAFHKMYMDAKNPTPELFAKVCNELHIHKLCTKTHMLTALVMPDDVINIRYSQYNGNIEKLTLEI